MSNVRPVFPKSYFSWSDRTDEVSNVLANDPNSIASELISVEKTLGVMPHQEKHPVAGPPITYSSVDARLTDIQQGNQVPFAEFGVNPMDVPNGATFSANVGNAPGKLNTYSPKWDNFNFYDGHTATIGITGAYLITAWQEWPFNTSGFVAMHLFFNAVTIGNGPAWQNMGIFNWSFPQTGPTRWDRTGFNNRQCMTELTWIGIANKGWRIQILSENGTPSPTQRVINGAMRIYYLRSTPPAQGLSG